MAAGLDRAALKDRIQVAKHYRYPEPPDASGRQAWHDYVFLFDRAEVLIEEVLSYPQDITQPPIRMRRFSRRRFADCSEEI